eukprot:5418430-Alexandrium_andersonii.AAC.1
MLVDALVGVCHVRIAQGSEQALEPRAALLRVAGAGGRVPFARSAARRRAQLEVAEAVQQPLAGRAESPAAGRRPST